MVLTITDRKKGSGAPYWIGYKDKSVKFGPSGRANSDQNLIQKDIMCAHQTGYASKMIVLTY